MEPRSSIGLVTLFSFEATEKFDPKGLELVPHLDREPLDPALDPCQRCFKPLLLRCPARSQTTAV